MRLKLFRSRDLAIHSFVRVMSGFFHKQSKQADRSFIFGKSDIQSGNPHKLHPQGICKSGHRLHRSHGLFRPFRPIRRLRWRDHEPDRIRAPFVAS